MEKPAPGPTLLTGDERVRAAVARAAAAAGVVPELHREARSLLVGWSSASVVLVGADAIGALAAASPPPRQQVYLVCCSPPERVALEDALRCAAIGVLELPQDESRLVELLIDTADGRSSLGTVIGVIGGAGGAGASTLAAALGLTLAQRRGSALLMDTDRYGGGLDQVLGLSPGTGVRWDALGQASGRLNARSLWETLPTRQQLSVVSWPADRSSLTPSTLRSVLSAGQRGYPAVVVDLPRADPEVWEEVLPRCERVLVVSTLTVPALAATLQLVKRMPGVGASAVLRGRGGVDSAEVARLLGIPVWHRMGDQRGLDEAISLGLGPLRARRGPLARAVSLVCERLESSH